MRLLKNVLAVCGALLVLAVIGALVAPKPAHALVATLVQLVPGSTTHVGQNETQLVSLTCSLHPYCQWIDPTGQVAPAPYVVPSGYTLILTDWEWFLLYGSSAEGIPIDDYVQNTVGYMTIVHGVAITNKLGGASAHEHYESGVRVGSGVIIQDFQASVGSGYSAIQGYLVPN